MGRLREFEIGEGQLRVKVEEDDDDIMSFCLKDQV